MEIPSPEARPDSFDHYPSIEDWEEIQGGKPTLWLNPAGNNIKVVHVYEDFGASSGRVINTPLTHVDGRLAIPEHMRHEIGVAFEDGRLIEFPAFMLLRFHGDPCEAHSRESHGGRGVGSSGEVIDSSQLASYRDDLRNRGYVELWAIPSKERDSKYTFAVKPRPTP